MEEGTHFAPAVRSNDFLSLLGINTLELILGKRPGEVISCIHAAEEPSGCGTSVACAYCGAVNAILESQKTGMKSQKETRISSLIDGKLKSWDLNISSNPIVLADQVFYVLMLQDISNEIMMQRQIRAAENGDLQVKTERVNSIDLLNSTIGKISYHEVGQNKHIVIADSSTNLDFETDKVLFQRVIINLIKNTLEATQIAGTITTGIENNGDKIKFWVKNGQVISEDVQMQLFQRSFSTKGVGRGIGTYSIKLLTENYLKGKVSFISNEKEGTIFSVELNKEFPANLP
jgi:hypothetical protein